MAEQAYRARNPRASPLWQCLDAHFDTFLDIYPEVYEREYGCLRPIIPEVVEKFMGCGDFAQGFARVRCDHCKHAVLGRKDAAQQLRGLDHLPLGVEPEDRAQLRGLQPL